MSKSEELLRLERDLNEQPELQEKIDTEIRRIAEAGEAECDGEAMAKAAAALGYTITLEELERAAADLEKLDDDELDAAGGMDPADESYREQAERRAKIIGKDEYGNYTYCFGPWHCYAAMLHTETVVRNVRCWNDYRCAMINKKIK